MKALRPSKKLIIVVVGFLLVILIVKTLLFLTAKPKVTVNYIVEYNKASRPQNYNPNDDAAPYYQRAFDAFVDMPDELKLKRPRLNWPTDFNDTEQALLEKWLTSNSQALKTFREAVNKPYYWLERRANKGDVVDDMLLPESTELRKLTEAIVWDAKLKAVKGQFQASFNNILDCYKAGKHKCYPNLLLMEQHIGLGIKQGAVRNAFVILDNSKADNDALKLFQDALLMEIDSDAYIPSIQTEKFLLYDALQRYFIDNGKGTGRLAFNVNLKYITLGGIWSNLKQKLYYCFKGPTRNEIEEQIKKVIALSDKAMTKTLWQIKNEDNDCLIEIRDINKSNFFLEILGTNPESIINLYNQTKAQTEALVTVLATLRFKIKSGQFPKTLNDLVSGGYLQTISKDPYSSEPLIYKQAKDDFKLYSVGVDFKDDGGVDKLDIIYWPVQQKRDDKLLSKYKPQEPDSYSWYPDKMKEALKRNQEAIRKRLEERGSVPPKL